jgi:5-methylthioadenosine/S-adenosylhomocysteine deaminase
MPGLINTHTHLGMTVLRGYLDDMELHTWLRKSWSIESKLTKEDVYLSSLLGCVEMIKNGITIFNDMYYFGDSTLRAIDESGMRGMFSQAVLDTPIMEFKTVDESFAILKNLRKMWKDNNRTLLSIGPHAIYTCSKETLLRTKEFAEKHNLLIHTHLSETKKEVEDCKKKTGKTPVKYLDSINFFSQNVIAAHCCWLTEKEILTLREHKVKVSHCPISNLKMTSGIAPLLEMIRNSLCVSLGTDSAASNNSLDLFQEMKFVALLHKFNVNNPTVIPAQTALDLATINGAKTLGLENQIGSIEVGKKLI